MPYRIVDNTGQNSRTFYFLLDAGIILVVTAIGLTQNELEIIQNVVDNDLIETIWLGDESTDIQALHIRNLENLDDSLDRIKGLLQDKGVIFKP